MARGGMVGGQLGLAALGATVPGGGVLGAAGAAGRPTGNALGPGGMGGAAQVSERGASE